MVLYPSIYYLIPFYITSYPFAFVKSERDRCLCFTNLVAKTYTRLASGDLLNPSG